MEIVTETAASAPLEAISDPLALPETAAADDPPTHRRRLRRRVRAPRPRPEQCHNCDFRAGDHNFCPNCGQENRIPTSGLFEIIRDAWDEFVKVDSRLVQTAAALLCHPGRLTSDYIAGKRMRYIAPFRLYLTVSFLFFLLLSNRSMSGLMSSLGPGYMHQSVPDALSSFKGHLHIKTDGLDGAPLPKTIAAYDSSQKSLPERKRDTAWKRYLMERLIGIQTRSVGDVLNDLLTTISRMMFLLLPVFALLLKLLYIRRRRAYVEHFVYALHIHTAFFLTLTLYLLLPIHGEFTVLEIGLLIYNVVALRRVYGQSYPKSILKMILLYSTYNIAFVFATLMAIAVALVF